MQKVRRVTVIVTVMKLSTKPLSKSTIKITEYKYEIYQKLLFLSQ